MKNILNKKAQEELFDFLYSPLTSKLSDEYSKRRELVRTEEEKKKYLTSEEVVKYITGRKNKFRVITLLAPVYKEMNEEEKKALSQFTYQDSYLKEYLEDEESFILTYNKNTDEGTDTECMFVAEKMLGIGQGVWRLTNQLETELRARLSVQQIAPFGEIVEKITSDIDINKFFENNNK